jgi:starch synthase
LAVVLTGCPSRYLAHFDTPIAVTDCPARRARCLVANYGAGMRVAMMTREYPPEVYGGAGVHVTELVAQLRRLCAVDVHCMGAPRPGAFAYQPDPRLQDANAALSTLSADLVMANAASAATVVHSHRSSP